ncbi:tripartite tricarboxylate transporter TctB family protein [Halomonas sp. AOP5-B2-8]
MYPFLIVGSKNMRLNEALLGAVFILAGLLIIFHANTFPGMPGQMVGPSTFPTIIGSGFFLGGILIAIKYFKERKKTSLLTVNKGWLKKKRILSSLVVIVGSMLFAFWIEEIGFVLGGVVLATTLLWLEGHRKPLILGCAVAFVMLVYYLLSHQLRVPLPSGPFI